MTTHDAATRLRLTREAVIYLIRAGRVQATRHGRDWWIEDYEVVRYERERRPPGRPRREPLPATQASGEPLAAADSTRPDTTPDTEPDTNARVTFPRARRNTSGDCHLGRRPRRDSNPRPPV